MRTQDHSLSVICAGFGRVSMNNPGSGTIVVGAGMSGLVRAYSLANRQEDVVLVESSGRAGGAVASERREGVLPDLGRHPVCPPPALWQLLGGLGLPGQALLRGPRRPRYRG